MTAQTPPIARVLEARLRPPYTAAHGLPPEQVAGLPRLHGAIMRGEYPLLRIDFKDDALPVHLSLEAFTPMVPLDAAVSGLPFTYLTYRATNQATQPVAVSIAISMANPVGWAGPEHGPDGSGGRCRNTRREGDGLHALEFSSERYGPEALRFGTAVLAVDTAHLPSDAQVTAKTTWRRAGWWDASQDWWDDFSADGRLTDHSYPEASPDGRQDIGTLGLHQHLAPGETAAFPFILAWHFPNRAATWGGPADDAPRTRTYYATRRPDAWSVAREAAVRREELTMRTIAFHRTLWGGTLPPTVIDAVASNLTALRSTTCFWLEGNGQADPRPEGGLFLAWEGCNDQSGCCSGDCTHVWNYAQAGAFLYPQLERSMRATEFGPALHPDGQMDFRVHPVFGETWNHIPAVDGQHGSILRLYREWRLSGDRALLSAHYPAARRALQFSAARWDPDGDGLPESEQHNTYDINFYGHNPLSAAFFLAGLRAGEEMARAVDDQNFARACHDLFERGRARAESVLWNGEYYFQNVPDADAHPYQFGAGCLSDQLLGQWLAHVCGLGHVLDPGRVQTALRAIVRYNFKGDLSAHASCQRTYALNDEAGLLLCTWPRGARPRYPFPYADEVWTGIEYQVAAHLIHEGLVEEGLRIVAAVRERHSGGNRNPWDEFECGHHYARSLSSYALIPALSGFDYDAVVARLTIAPRLPGNHRCFFSVPAAWGMWEVEGGSVRVTVIEGRLPLSELRLGGRKAEFPKGQAVVPQAPLEVRM